MQLDRTEIVIRQRTPLEIMDLSLLVLRRHFFQLIAASAALSFPVLAIDAWLCHWMVTESGLLAAEGLFTPETTASWRFVCHLIALYVVQFPLVSLPLTILLGAAMFFEPMGWREIGRRMRAVWLPALVVLGLARLGAVLMWLELLVDRDLAFDPSTEIWLLVVGPAVALLIRMLWPFAPEILALERCPLRSQPAKPIAFATRKRVLHGPLQGNMIVQFLVAACYSALLLAMLLSTILFVQAVIAGSWSWNPLILYVAVPLCLSMAGMFLTVYRFLCYLDARICLEGWEVDLRLRAEAARLTDASDVPLPTSTAEVTRPS